MRRITTVPALRAELAASQRAGERIALVPTMGALHRGHLALVERAARHADRVVVSIFVNPTQFDRPDDLAAYPRDLAGDEAALRGLGSASPSVVFVPEVAQMYPTPPLTTVRVAELTTTLCGATRPGHFDGVATVVTKLCNIVRPDVAVFGRKDAQQLQVVRRLVVDLDLDVEIVAAPTVREPDGLALSSRNRRLTPEARIDARALPAALRAALDAATTTRASGGRPDPVLVRAAAERRLVASPGVDVEYLEVVDPTTLRTAELPAPRLLVAIAAHVGRVRLIDNVEIGDADDERRLEAAVPTARPEREA